MTCNKYKNIHSDTNFTAWPKTGLVDFFVRLTKSLTGPRRDQITMSAALDKGSREYQEDVVLTDFKEGSDLSICVLADGMGGHTNGGTASGIVSQIIRDGLKRNLTMESSAQEIKDLLSDFTQKANQEIAKHIKNNGLADDMGTTLVAIVIKGKELYWISIGDSPIYLFRKRKIKQLNQDHSMAPQIDELMEMGVITRDSAKNHLDRNRLTSAIMGNEINRIDLPETPTELLPKDILIVCSDGLQFLSDSEIETIIKQKSNASASEITETLMNNVLALNSPTQDNIGICTVRYQKAKG